MSCVCHVTAVKVGREYMSEKAAAVEIEPFKPRAGVTIHTNDEEAKEAEMQGGSASKSPLAKLGRLRSFTVYR